MKFQRVVRVSGLSTWMWIAAVAPAMSMESAPKVPGKSLAVLIGDLADDKFGIREAASREIWAIGEPALPSLERAASGEDPEQAYRARELIHKIQLSITPETDPAIVELVGRYAKSSPNEKRTLLDQMRKKRAWRQILKLYAAETDPKLRARLARSVEGVALIAARECLLDGDVKGARGFLEMAPADAPGLLALADFHRSQGTLDAELKRAKALTGAHGDAWRLALFRASGNLKAARDSANAAGEFKLSATMAALLGDPLPWLRGNQRGGDGGDILKPYTQVAIQRWQGKAIRRLDLEPLVQSVHSRNRLERQAGMNALFLLGEIGLAEPAYAKNSPLEAFSYFESLERIGEALQTLGLDPENPDYRAWVEQRMGQLGKDDAENEREVSTGWQELVALASFLERRGLHEVASAAFLTPMAALAEKDVHVFSDFLAALFGDGETMEAAPQLAKRAAIPWAGEDADRWERLVDAAFGGRDETLVLWDWLADLKPAAGRSERLDGMLALYGMEPDRHQLSSHWLALAWAAIGQTPADKQKPMLERMAFLARQHGDAANNLRVWDQLAESRRYEIFWRTHILDLSAAQRWQEAATFFLRQIDERVTAREDPQPSLHACAAACLRKAGHPEEARGQDALVEKLALGNDAVEIANGYAYGADYTRAAEWRARAVRQADPGSDDFVVALQLHLEILLEQGRWKEAAAVSEVMAQLAALVESNNESPLTCLRLRHQSDLGRALADLNNNRAESVAILGNCYRLFSSDGSLADYFFPALRKMGLTQEHDEWFKASWARMSAVIERFPASDNTCNTAAWLASRAQRQLDLAEQHLEKALTMNPDKSAYLDTMAEIQFAKGNREKALEWSSRAVNLSPMDMQLRRQHERFRVGPLPR